MSFINKLLVLLRSKRGKGHTYSYCKMPAGNWTEGKWYAGPVEGFMPTKIFAGWVNAIFDTKQEAKAKRDSWLQATLSSYGIAKKKEEVKSDSDKLRLLADWLDKKYIKDPNPEVQSDLRRIATKLEAK